MVIDTVPEQKQEPIEEAPKPVTFPPPELAAPAPTVFKRRAGGTRYGPARSWDEMTFTELEEMFIQLEAAGKSMRLRIKNQKKEIRRLNQALQNRRFMEYRDGMTNDVLAEMVEQHRLLNIQLLEKLERIETEKATLQGQYDNLSKKFELATDYPAPPPMPPIILEQVPA